MVRPFRKIFFITIAVAGLTQASFAQDNDNYPKPITKSGSAAWMFTISGLGPFGMSGLDFAEFQVPQSGETPAKFIVFGAGGKWYFVDNMALRAMLGFTTSTDGDTDPTKSPGGKTTTTIFGIAAGIEMHTHPVYSSSPYFGAQISFASGGSDNQITTSGTTTETKSSGTAFGIGVLAGFDWYFTNAIAVGGEYMLGFNTTSLSSTDAGKTTNMPSSTNIGISSGSVHLVVHM